MQFIYIHTLLQYSPLQEASELHDTLRVLFQHRRMTKNTPCCATGGVGRILFNLQILLFLGLST
jgi:hypothetical protein